MMYQAAVTLTVAKVEDRDFDPFIIHVLRRFQPFVWMCVWTILVTGVVLMLFDTRFVFFHYADRWSVLLGSKQLVFVTLIFFNVGYARMFARVADMVRRKESREDVLPFYRQMMFFGRINVGLAIVAVLIAAGMK
jgi:uncharacterized membrane protein